MAQREVVEVVGFAVNLDIPLCGSVALDGEGYAFYGYCHVVDALWVIEDSSAYHLLSNMAPLMIICSALMVTVVYMSRLSLSLKYSFSPTQ